MATRQQTLLLNGERYASAAATVADLVQELQLDIRQIAIEHNRSILARPTYEKTPLRDGDVVEIVSFIGGG